MDKAYLADFVRRSSGFLELRYHRRQTQNFSVQNGRVDLATTSEKVGIGVRALRDGAWGFAATASLEPKAIEKAIEQAQKAAAMLAQARGKKDLKLTRDYLAREDFVGEGVLELASMPIEAKLGHVVQAEQKVKNSSPHISLASVSYNEIKEEKVIVTSDGAEASLSIVLPEYRLNAVAQKDGERVQSHTRAGVNGGWQCLFKHPALDQAVDRTAGLAVDLLSAPYPDGGLKTVVLTPAVVGLLCHEAIGHTVEADFVKAGSVAQGRVGTRVGSDLVSLCDTGLPFKGNFATGILPFDDEGVKTENTVIIDKGILVGYLHNRESASEFGVKPTGNARAWSYSDEPLIRMRNTYMMPGSSSLTDMIAGIDDGYFLDGASNGQADSNGEFMFACTHAYEIKQGKKGRLLRNAAMSGIAFDVLKSIDAISDEFLWDLGSGYCGKGQPAKVDAGGPYVRCQMLIGGR